MSRGRLAVAVPVAVLVALVMLLSSCADGDGSETSPSGTSGAQATATSTGPTATQGTPTRTSSAPTEPDAALADGRHPARIVRVDAPSHRVTIDVVQFFTGDAAASAAAEDGSPEVPPPNDYWIRNVNDLLRTLPLAADARVTTNTLTASETGDATKDVQVSLERLASFRRLEAALFWVTVANRTVVQMNEQYLP